jgi:inhibitor of KinA sporulation pathway (predicted exonuclease)
MTDSVLVVDIEATCWQRNRVPPGEQNEIIEIGWCAVNREPLEMGEPHTILLKPQRSHLSPFCTRLTSITPEMTAQGMLFNEACTILRRNFATQNMLWVSWGDYDLKMFQQQCEQFQVTYPFSERHINLRQLYAKLNPSATGKVRQVGLMKALAAQGLTFEGRKHRGVDDAWNTARLLQAMIAKHGAGILDS